MRSWPMRFIRWLFGSPFRELPATFGNTVPADLQVFQAQANEAQKHGLGMVATAPLVHHAKTQPARLASWMERQ